jgi:hypothetical protein
MENKRLTKAAIRGKTALARHPCSICGLPTRSKLPVCGRQGECQAEYSRLARGAAPGAVQRRADLLARTRPCSICGKPTASKLGVCTRLGECRTENLRLGTRERRGAELGPKVQRVPMTRERRNEQVRRQRQTQKGMPSVYAVWFPAPRILKVGFTTDTQNSIFTGTARTRAKRRNWDTEGASCIWRQPGDTRTEAWMQATLAFRWQAAFEQKHTRICEWFQVPDLTEDAIVTVLDEAYGQVPADLTKLAPIGTQLPMF